MSNKPHLRPHQKKRQASQITRLLVAILILAFFALAITLEATGHVVFRGRLISLEAVAPLVRRGDAAPDGGICPGHALPARPARLRSPASLPCVLTGPPDNGNDGASLSPQPQRWSIVAVKSGPRSMRQPRYAGPLAVDGGSAAVACSAGRLSASSP